MSERKEIQVPDISRPKKVKPKAKVKKRITYETTTVVLAIVCSLMGIWIGYTDGFFVANTLGQKIALFIILPFFILLGICNLCDKVTKEKTPADDGQSNSKGRANRQFDY